MLKRAIATSVVALAVAAPVATATDTVKSSKQLRSQVSVTGIRVHQTAFELISKLNGGNRLAGRPGHDASAAYVGLVARLAGYKVSYQEFDYDYEGDLTPPVLTRLAPAPTKDYVNGFEFASGSSNTDIGSANGDVTGELFAADLQIPPLGNSTSGCETTDFTGFVAGQIALVQRGTCPFTQKVANATAAGAAAVIVFNEGNTPERSGLPNPDVPGSTIPVLQATFATGAELANGDNQGTSGVRVRVRVDRAQVTLPTRNVIAESRTGDPNNTIVVGAHLDSVETGPGINDNGSGSGALLEIARGLRQEKLRNRVRFIWFSAEESGLLGSEHYAETLRPEERDKIAAMLNFDMLDSPNFVRFVYDGDLSDSEAPECGAPSGSAEIEDIFLDYFAAQGLPVEPTEFSGRSDYGPFLCIGVPAGGLFSGAEVLKTPEQEAIYGGAAGEQYDPCYHAFCDSLKYLLGTPPAVALRNPANAEKLRNNSRRGLDQLSDAAAHATLTLAQARTLPGAGAPATAARAAAAAAHDDDEAAVSR